MGLGAKADRFNVQIGKAFVLRIADQLLGFDGHKFRVEPRSEHLPIERLIPAIVVVLVGIFEFNCCGVGFNLSDIEEHLVDFLVGVDVGTT